MTPTLTTKRLTLVPFTVEMVENHHVAWLNDPEVVKYSEQRHRTHTIESQYVYLNEFPPNSHIWLIRQNDWSPPDVGTATCYMDTLNQTANLGILIGAKDAWGERYGSEALMAVMLWAQSAGVRKFECGMRDDNKPMVGVARAVGMHQEARVPSHFRADDGRRLDMLLYGVCW